MGPIAAKLNQIELAFEMFDPDALECADPAVLLRRLRELRCGNRSSRGQIEGLAENIRTFRRIEREFGSIDAFVTSATPDTVAKVLAQPGEYKLRFVGYTLALEYLRNVGIRAAKPDVHVRRIISSERLGYTRAYPAEEEASAVVAELAREARCSATYLDNLLWIYCAQDYGRVCGAQPRCGVCSFRTTCNYPRHRVSP